MTKEMKASASFSVRPAQKAAGGRCRRTALLRKMGIGSTRVCSLQYLREGDDFAVYADDDGMPFHGIIHQDALTGAIPRQVIRNDKLANHPTWKQQAVGGMWVHWIQKGIDPEVWGQLFTGNKRCLVRREEKTRRTARTRRRN
jgi:hypothetical protein